MQKISCKNPVFTSVEGVGQHAMQGGACCTSADTYQSPTRMLTRWPSPRAGSSSGRVQKLHRAPYDGFVLAHQCLGAGLSYAGLPPMLSFARSAPLQYSPVRRSFGGAFLPPQAACPLLPRSLAPLLRLRPGRRSVYCASSVPLHAQQARCLRQPRTAGPPTLDHQSLVQHGYPAR